MSFKNWGGFLKILILLDFFPNSQLFAILVLANGGQDLEHYNLKSWPATKSILLQLMLSLATAESSHLRFEHRDLHWGNVLGI